MFETDNDTDYYHSVVQFVSLVVEVAVQNLHYPYSIFFSKLAGVV
jgi:hypothetical protein